MKKPREYTLRPLMTAVDVQSLANGHFQVMPHWKDGIYPLGFMTRLAAAERLEKLINDYLRKR